MISDICCRYLFVYYGFVGSARCFCNLAFGNCFWLNLKDAKYLTRLKLISWWRTQVYDHNCVFAHREAAGAPEMRQFEMVHKSCL